ncbi:hypothetical protein Taro_028622 [Colocasia esculenta]|uniref:Uncharacterized protein n=1 Tax=Colocasia esculenta TaxID=4460 RepID=A0A843VHQ3_COLES|nr:hypothetical protein [Colocasia esculenta]
MRRHRGCTNSCNKNTRHKQELGVNALTPRSTCASSDLTVHSWNGQRPPPSVVGDETLVEETLETDSERGD